MLVIFLLMALHPEVQKKAQEEIDSITGGGQRMVALEDRPNMPYIRAMLLEIERWHVVVPMSKFPPVKRNQSSLGSVGVPRRTAETDMYKGKITHTGLVRYLLDNTYCTRLYDPLGYHCNSKHLVCLHVSFNGFLTDDKIGRYHKRSTTQNGLTLRDS